MRLSGWDPPADAKVWLDNATEHADKAEEAARLEQMMPYVNWAVLEAKRGMPENTDPYASYSTVSIVHWSLN